jgi:hypothetical protein
MEHTDTPAQARHNEEMEQELLTRYDRRRAHWLFWELGLLAALAALIATPAESIQQAMVGILCLLFLMGLANQGSERR